MAFVIAFLSFFVPSSLPIKLLIGLLVLLRICISDLLKHVSAPTALATKASGVFNFHESHQALV